VAVRLGISYYKIDLKALDKAYSIAFPTSTPINKSKKKVVRPSKILTLEKLK